MEFTKTIAIAVVVIAILAIVVFVAVPSFFVSSILRSQGANSTISFNQSIAELKNTTQTVLVHVLAQKNTVLFNIPQVNLVVLAADGQLASQITGANVDPSLGPDYLMVSGLPYPNLVISDNATLDLKFINLLGGEACSLYITTINPSTEANTGIQLSQQLGAVLVTPTIPAANLTSRMAHEYSSKVPVVSGDLWYTSSCTPSEYGHISVGG